MCGWLGRQDPLEAAEHGEESPGVVGPSGLTPGDEAGMTLAEVELIEHEAEERGVANLLAGHDEEELGSHEVRRLAVRGIGAVLVRTISLRGITFAGNIILARILAPETFGVFAIANFVVLIAAFLADMGLGAALVQRKDSLTEEDLRAAFTLGLIVDATFTLALVLLAPAIVALYRGGGVEPQYARIVQIMACTLLVSTFAVVPSIQLERKLRFKDAANAEVAASLVYVVTAVSLAAAGLHVIAFVIASIASRVLHTIIVNVMAPWRPRFGLARRSIKAIMAFGIPYQINGIVIQLKDNFVPIFLGIVTGPKSVGYVNWAVGLATNALFLQTIVSRVTFPTYARLQHDLPALKDSIEKSIKWISATVFPVTFLLMALAHQLVRFLYGPKWAPGLPSFYMLCVPILAASYSSVLVSALHGVGRAKVVLKLTTIWAVAGWAIAVPLVYVKHLRFNGFALAMMFVSVLSVLSVREMNKIVKIRFVRAQLRLAVLAGIPAFGVWVMSYRVVHGIPSLIALAGFGGLAYLGILALSGEIAEVRGYIKGALQRA